MFVRALVPFGACTFGVVPAGNLGLFLGRPRVGLGGTTPLGLPLALTFTFTFLYETLRHWRRTFFVFVRTLVAPFARPSLELVAKSLDLALVVDRRTGHLGPFRIRARRRPTRPRAI